MLNIKSTLLGLLALLLSLTTEAQIYDPAITAITFNPVPIPGGVGAPLSMTFTMGNLGYMDISGANAANRMSFGISLGKCAPATIDALQSLSGDILPYFDVTYFPGTGASQGGNFEGTQKKGTVIPARSLFDLYINTVVTVASSNTNINDIGASCNIQANATANPQPTDNDFASRYTHTTNIPQPVSLVSFTAQAQTDHTVLLNWKASWEVANNGFVIERSKDLKSFEAVGQVTDVASSSNSINTYQFVDQRPNRGTSYYRLVQVDGDGSRHVYKAESVVIDGRYGVYPNPVRAASFSVDLDEPGSAVLHLYEVSGRSVPVTHSVLGESSTQVIPAVKLSPGVYVLTVEERGTIRKHRVIMP